MSQVVTLWAPYLLNAPAIQAAGSQLKSLKLPSLRTLLTKADAHTSETRDYFNTASYLFHQKTTLPIAPCMLAGLSDENTNTLHQAFWLKIDPVQVVPDRTSLVLMPPSQLAIQAEESQALCQAFNQHFANDGLVLVYGDATHWFLHVPQTIDLQTTPLAEAAGQPIQNFMPQGGAGRYWQSLMNEAQMLFYAHPVNETRRQAGLPEINSIWPWGQGTLDKAGLYARAKAQVFSDHAYVRGMGKLCGAGVHKTPLNHQAWLNLASKKQPENFIVLDSVAKNAQDYTLSEWLDTLAWLEEAWLAPLLSQLQQKQISALLIDLGYHQYFHLTPSNLKRFWRFRNPIF